MSNEVARVPEVLDAGGQELEPFQEDGGILSGFLSGMGAFFTKARKLEDKADALAVRAKALQAPANAEEDAALQRFVQEANGATKAIEDAWDVATAFHRFHRKLTAARERGAAKSRGAAERAQKLHNGYVEAERRRVAEENARREREALEAAERKRAAELAAAEAEAVKREEASAELSEREKLYLGFFLAGMKAQEAAKRAGYKDPVAAAARLNTSGKMQAAIKAAQEAAAIRRQAAATAAAPLQVEEPERVEVEIQKEGTDRTTWRGEVLDERLFIEAVLGGRHGIPADVLTVNQAKLTEYARSMHKLMDRWPGVRAVSSTKTI